MVTRDKVPHDKRLSGSITVTIDEMRTNPKPLASILGLHMGYETGAVKWAIGMLLTPVGFVSLYLFGDAIWNTVTHLQALFHLLQFVDQPQVLVMGLVEIYVPTPESVDHIDSRATPFDDGELNRTSCGASSNRW